MSPIDIIRTVGALIPLIQESGNAEETLLKYAREHELAPEQLIKMGQCLNTSRALAWMDNNPQARGATFPLVDPTKLAATYTEFKTAPVKRASVTFLDAAPAPNFFQKADMPTAAAEPETVKVASTPELTRAEIIEQQDIGLRNIATLTMVRDDAWDIFDKHAEDLTRVIRAKSAHFPQILEDVSQLDPKSLVTLKYAAKRAAAYGAFTQTPTTTKRFVAYDRHNILPTIKAAAECLTRIRICDQLIAEEAKTSQLVLTKSGAFPDPDEQVNVAQPEDGEDATESEVPSRNAPQAGRRHAPVRRNPADPAPRGPRRGSGDIPSNNNGGMAGSPPPPVDKGDGKGGGKDKGPDIAKMVADALTMFGKGTDAVTERVISKDLPLMLQGYAPAKRQQKIDTSVRDTMTSANLQRLIMADPILQEANPQQLISIFNDLQMDDPTIGQNMNRLRFALREALQYDGGIPLHTSKGLAEIDKLRQDAGSKRRQAMSELYA